MTNVTLQFNRENLTFSINITDSLTFSLEKWCLASYFILQLKIYHTWIDLNVNSKTNTFNGKHGWWQIS